MTDGEQADTSKANSSRREAMRRIAAGGLLLSMPNVLGGCGVSDSGLYPSGNRDSDDPGSDLDPAGILEGTWSFSEARHAGDYACCGLQHYSAVIEHAGDACLLKFAGGHEASGHYVGNTLAIDTPFEVPDGSATLTVTSMALHLEGSDVLAGTCEWTRDDVTGSCSGTSEFRAVRDGAPYTSTYGSCYTSGYESTVPVEYCSEALYSTYSSGAYGSYSSGSVYASAVTYNSGASDWSVYESYASNVYTSYSSGAYNSYTSVYQSGCNPVTYQSNVYLSYSSCS